MLTPYDRRECVAFAKALACFTARSNQRGCDNEEIHRSMGHYIRGLIKHGVFPKDVYLGRLGWCGNPNHKRVALAVPLLAVTARREQIIETLEFKMNVLYAEEVYDLLTVASLNAATNGYLDMLQNPGLIRFIDYAVRPGNWVRACQLLNSEQALRNILGASQPELPKAIA